MVTLGLATPLFNLGLTNALVRFLAAQKEKRKIQEGFFSVLCVMLSCGIAIGLILFFLADPISENFFGTAPIIVVQMTSIIIPFLALNTACLSFLITFGQIRTYSILVLARSFGEIGLIAGLVLAGFGISGVVLSLLIVVVLTSGVALYIIVSQIGLKRPDFSQLKSYFKFGLPLLPTILFAFVTESSDRYVINYFLGISSVGIYSAGYSIANVLRFLRYPLSQILPPALSKSYDEDRISEVRTYLRYSLKYLLMLTIPAVVGISILSTQILQVFTAAEFVREGHSVVPFVALSMVFFGIYSVAGLQVLRLTQKTGPLGIIWAIAGVTNLALNFVFVPRFGILAAAGATLLAYIIATGITLYYSTRELTFKVDWLSIIKSLAASGVMAATILAINATGIWQLLLVIGLGVIVYGMVLFFLRGFSRNEIRFFLNLFRRTSTDD